VLAKDFVCYSSLLSQFVHNGTGEMQQFPGSFTHPNPYILEDATGEMQRFPGSFPNPNPYILEDAQQSRVPRRKRYWENQKGKRKSPYQSQFSGARDGASVLDSKRNASRNLQVCSMGATRAASWFCFQNYFTSC
jgi:hypothetical protein